MFFSTTGPDQYQPVAVEVPTGYNCLIGTYESTGTPTCFKIGNGLTLSGTTTVMASSRSFNTNPGRSLTTSATASGFQPSSSRDTFVQYGITVSTTATIGGNSAGYVVLETSPTNSATSGDWVEVGSRCGNEQSISLAVALQSVQTTHCQLHDIVPAGYYIKLRKVTVSGSPAFTLQTNQKEVQF